MAAQRRARFVAMNRHSCGYGGLEFRFIRMVLKIAHDLLLSTDCRTTTMAK